MELREGDRIEIVTNKVDQPGRTGVVRRVLQEDPLRLEVEWDDGHASLIVPPAGNVHVHSGAG